MSIRLVSVVQQPEAGGGAGQWRRAWLDSPWGAAVGGILLAQILLGSFSRGRFVQGRFGTSGASERGSRADLIPNGADRVPPAPQPAGDLSVAGDPSVAELRQVTGIGDVLARRILASRWSWPPSEQAHALEDVEGLGPVRRGRIAQRGLLEHEPSLEFGAGRAPGGGAGTLRVGVLAPVLIPADAEPAPHPSDG